MKSPAADLPNTFLSNLAPERTVQCPSVFPRYESTPPMTRITSGAITAHGGFITQFTLANARGGFASRSEPARAKKPGCDATSTSQPLRPRGNLCPIENESDRLQHVMNGMTMSNLRGSVENMCFIDEIRIG